MHKKFIDYKKEAQLNYISKLVGLQEKVDYLENKNREYEDEIERYQVDLKQKTNIIHKLAHINNEVQSTLSYWPTFYPPQPQLVSEPKSPFTQDKDQDDLAFVEANKSPVVVSISKQEEQEIKEETKQDIQIETDQPEKVEKEEEGINVRTEVNNNLEEEAINVQTESKENLEQVVELCENIINEELNVSNEDVQRQDATEEKEELKQENSPLSNKNEILEENQAILETQQFQENIEIEPLEDAWGVEEPILIENEANQQEQGKLQELPLENKVFTAEPEEQNHVEVHQTIENESPPVELTHNEEPPKFSEKIEEKEERPVINTLTAPPSNRLLQKKKKGGPPPRQFVGFKPTATAFEPVEEPIRPQVEEVHDNASDLVHKVDEETDKQPPMNSFVGFKPSVGKIPFKRPNPPQFSKPC